MRIILVYVFLILLFVGKVKSQMVNDFFNLINYRNDQSIVIGANSFSYTALDEFGKVRILNDRFNDTYIFQGQEFDANLGIYFFPSRIYSSGDIKFYQPDPKSQYHSPYLFVGADPINYTDYSGKEGKPLIIYQEDQDRAGGMPTGLRDIQGVVPDANYVPMSSFMNGEVGDLSEWNGRVFINGHTGPTEGRELSSEISYRSDAFKTGDFAGVAAPEYNTFFGRNLVTVDGKEFGKSLRRFSEERGVPIRSVTVGGCEGHWASEAIHKGFMEESKKIGFKNRRIKFKGLKDGRYASYVGENTNKSLFLDEYPKSTRLYLNPSATGAERGIPFEMKGGKKIFTGFKSKLPGSRSFTSDPFVEDEGLNSFISEGRTPSKLKKYYSKIVEMY